MQLTPYRRSQLLPKIAHVHSLDEVKKIDFNVETTRPPNFEAIKKHFPFAEKPGVLFTHGKTIFNPSGVRLTVALIAHECTHIIQQAALGAEHWWEFYYHDKQFRYDQELDAYSIEFRTFSLDHNRADRSRYLRSCAERLSGPLYGRMARRRDSQKLIRLIRDEERARLREKSSDGHCAACTSAEPSASGDFDAARSLAVGASI